MLHPSKWRTALWLCWPLALGTPALGAPVVWNQDPPAPPEGPQEEGPQEKDDEEKGDEEKDPHLKQWPELENQAGTKKEVQRLVKARTEEMGKDAAEKLAKIGAGAAPLLLSELGRARQKEAIQRIEATLIEITGAPHTRLLAEHFSDKKENVRRFALERVSHFPDPGTRKQAEAAYATSQDKKSRWEPVDRYLAALCCAAAGSEKSLDELIATARKDWGKRRADLSRVMPALRSDALSERLVAEVGTADRQDTVDCLRLLSLCGTKKSIPYVKPLLDSGDASIRVAAINACRGIITGEPPVGKLSAFEAIELAKEWKAKL